MMIHVLLSAVLPDGWATEFSCASFKVKLAAYVRQLCVSENSRGFEYLLLEFVQKRAQKCISKHKSTNPIKLSLEFCKKCTVKVVRVIGDDKIVSMFLFEDFIQLTP